MRSRIGLLAFCAVITFASNMTAKMEQRKDTAFAEHAKDGSRIGKNLSVPSRNSRISARNESLEPELRLKQVKNTSNEVISMVLHTDQIGEPISPYIYGEFIEHQGRCIYGGIWAEMIEDRKFFYPINTYAPDDTAAKSPWHIATIGSHVTMDTAFAFVGKHSPRIDLDGHSPGGIIQDSLAVRQGKEYTGRILLMGSESVAVKVSLIWGDEPSDRQTIIIDRLSPKYITIPLRFTCAASTNYGHIEIIGEGQGFFRIGTISLMPADNIKGMRADVIDLLKKLDATIYRWPGGSFVNVYDWRNAIGDRDKRAPSINHVYGPEQIESFDFGPDEFMIFVQELGAEAYIAAKAINAGDAQLAADEVAYFNGATNTPMGLLRAANGHPDPYGVRFWGIGNEAYFYSKLSDYTAIHNQVAQAMQAVDPSIKIIAVGGYKSSGPAISEGDWSEIMLTHCADYMHLISEHDYMMPQDDPILHSKMIAIGVELYAKAHRRFRQQLPFLQGKDIRIALDEWNYIWFQKPYLYGDTGVRYYFRDALGFARALNAMFRNSDIIYMANTQPVNVLGNIKTTDTDAAFEVTALPLIIYRHHFGSLPITISGNIDTLDVAAAWTDDGNYITLSIVNPMQQSRVLSLELENARLTDKGRWWRIESPDPLAYNEPGHPPRVSIEEGEQSAASQVFEVPPMCVIVYELPASLSKPSSIFKFIRTVQVTPDTIFQNFKNSSFCNIHYLPQTDRIIVIASTFLDKPEGGYIGKATIAKEYFTTMQPTGRAWPLNGALADVASQVIGNYLYLVSMVEGPAAPATGEPQWIGWRLEKFDTSSWIKLNSIDIPLSVPNSTLLEANNSPTISYVNGLLDISGEYYVNGDPASLLGKGSHHHFFTTDLVPQGKMILEPPHYPSHCPKVSMFQTEEGDIIMFAATSFNGNIQLLKFDKEWNCIEQKTFDKPGRFPAGIAADSNRFYVAYIDYTHRSLGEESCIRLASFDKYWNSLDDITVTTPEVNKRAHSPWLMLHKNFLYVSYVIDWGYKLGQSYVGIYELAQRPTAIAQKEAELNEFKLEQNYPNPFNPITTINYSLPKSIHIKLAIYDMLGQEVRILVDATESAGHHQAAWNGKNEDGSYVASGIYYCRMKAGTFVETKKLLFLR